MEEDLRDLERDQLRQVNESGLQYLLSDYKIWWLGMALSSMIVALSFGNFFPTLCATMGFSPTITLVLCAPPWLAGTITSFLVTRFFVVFDITFRTVLDFSFPTDTRILVVIGSGISLAL